MAIVLGGLYHFYKNVTTSGKLGSLIVFISKEQIIPKKSQKFHIFFSNSKNSPQK
jgi:Zn/Cd-binding protein ZinT